MDESNPIPPDTNYAPKFLIICGLTLFLGVCLCIFRIYSRIVPVPRLSLDDYLIATAAIICIATYITSCINAAHGWGHISHYVLPAHRITAFKCLFAQQFLWCVSTALVRISVAFSLLRLSASKVWRGSLYAMIVIQIFIYLGFLIFLFGHAWPIRANWEHVPHVKEWNRIYESTYGRVANPIIILLDVVLALMPIQLIRTLHRNIYEKILICSLMAMGLFAAGIAAYKVTLSTKISQGDRLSTSVEFSLWNRLEGLVGLIAACMPCLKSRAERFLRRISVLSPHVGFTRPSFVVSLRERRMRTSENSGGEIWRTSSVHICEGSVTRKELARPGLKDSVLALEDEFALP